MSRRDELVLDRLDVEVVGRRTPLVPRIKAVLSGGGMSEDDDDAVDTGMTGAITTSTATPMDIVIRVVVRRTYAAAPKRPYPVMMSSPLRTMFVAGSSKCDAVALLRNGESLVVTPVGMARAQAISAADLQAASIVFRLATATRIAPAPDSRRRVEPSISVSRNVTTPDGAPQRTSAQNDTQSLVNAAIATDFRDPWRRH